MTGTKIDRYEVVRELGRGAMGVVYLARHDTTGREVALKVLHGDSAGSGGTATKAALERFQREARAMGAVASSENVVSVLDAGMDSASGSPFLVMELLSGEDLEGLSARLGPLPVDLALRVVAQALAGLSPAHEAGIVHRDIKPSNLFLMKRPDGEHVVKVLDFGIAKLREGTQEQGGAKLTAEGTAVGSPAYMSPEQVQALKSLDVRSDVWSMGIVLYQLLSGKLPFAEADTLRDLLMAIVLGRAEPVSVRAPWVPASVQAVLDRATHKEPAGRFANAREMREAILGLLGGPGAPTGISEAMLRPVPAEVRSLPAPAPAPVTVAASQLPGSATVPIPAMSGAPGTMSASGPVASADTAPMVSVVSPAAPPAAAIPGPPFAFPTQPSRGVGMAPAAAPTPTTSRWPLVIAVVGVLLVGLIAAGVFAMSSRGTSTSSANEADAAPPSPDASSQTATGATTTAPTTTAPTTSGTTTTETPQAATTATATSTAKALAPPPKSTGRPAGAATPTTTNKSTDPFGPSAK